MNTSEAAEVDERPFPVTAVEVRGILDGRQVQLRRVINPQPPAEATSFTRSRALFSNTWIANGRGRGLRAIDCPYGQPGDRLWIRETWTLGRVRLDNEDGNSHARVHKPRKDLVQPVLYRANQLANDSDHLWRQSTHMPRWASRLTLEITDIRAERLQEINEADTEAAGVHKFHLPLAGPDGMDIYARNWPNPICGETAKNAFALEWNHFNAKRGYSWDSNPWVWVVCFIPVKNAG